MLTPERHRIILEVLSQHEVAKIQDFVDATSSSESTIRRDLSQLEEEGKLKRVHGGASLLIQKRNELSYTEKSTKNHEEKEAIAKYAAGLIRDGDCIYLDAGTTTNKLVRSIVARDVTVVTNDIMLLETLIDHQIETYLIGGLIKHKTKALIGSGALEGLRRYRFDKCFLGINGIHPDYGFTTPDPEEAAVKSLALQLSQSKYVLADHTKFHEVTFAKIADVHQAVIITNKTDDELLIDFNNKTDIITV
ncbi:DeoR/GlpR family DNA-binding transcription regulator [Bacillus sp. PS06]|uniref:DeoR/GlpR family DNA-binding transcription regulator n=1 Tax=Bacillus sp. PS06 TaxID=2764176 RepID=UPI00177FBED1|nr:DeoR/GlpR family DNA-binding transcription regulator [Bacillus sp. PS06]MBD8067695.1 DeoR/GlpR transcriptional regulator [Bacillus sp. PS06]